MTTIISNIVSFKIYMCQCLISCSNEIAKFDSSFVSYVIPPQIKTLDHVSAIWEITEFFDMLVRDF